VEQGSSDGGFSMDDFHTLWERVSMMRIEYQQLLTDRDYLLGISELYHNDLKGAGVGGRPTHLRVGEHLRILERHTDCPSRIRVYIRWVS
jgi:hypothetical protein